MYICQTCKRWLQENKYLNGSNELSPPRELGSRGNFKRLLSIKFVPGRIK